MLRHSKGWGLGEGGEKKGKKKKRVWFNVVREGFLEEGGFNNSVKQWFAARNIFKLYMSLPSLFTTLEPIRIEGGR